MWRGLLYELVREHNSSMAISKLVFLLQGVFLTVALSSAVAVQGAPARSAPTAPVAGAAPVPSVVAGQNSSGAESLDIVTRVVGEVGHRVVTSREVAINDAIAQVLSGLPLGSDKAVIKPLDATFAGQVIRVLDEWTVFFEAVDIDARNADKVDVAKWQRAVQEQWKGVASWEKLEASAAEIKEIIEHKLVAQGFERLKVDASLVSISDQEALQYYKKNRLRFGGLPFENFKDNIKAALAKGQTERRLVEWRTVLRRKYRVRNYLGA